MSTNVLTATLEPLIGKSVLALVNDGKIFVGKLNGFDQTSNICLANCHERVYRSDEGVEVVELGLYVIRGDNLAVLGEIDENIDKIQDWENIRASPLLSVANSSNQARDGADVHKQVIQKNAIKGFGKHETVLIFDWDDTLLPTTYLARSGLKVDSAIVPSNIRDMLTDHTEGVIATLLEAKEHGDVIIVTNAENGWIDLTVKKFMPNVAPYLEGIERISARSTYEPKGIRNPFEWKQHCFSSIINRFDSHNEDFDEDCLPKPRLYRNVLSLGDSSHEREAILSVCRPVADLLCKSLKFMERPDIGYLGKEHGLIRKFLPQIVQYGSNMDLCIQCQPNEDEEEQVVPEQVANMPHTPTTPPRLVEECPDDAEKRPIDYCSDGITQAAVAALRGDDEAAHVVESAVVHDNEECCKLNDNCKKVRTDTPDSVATTVGSTDVLSPERVMEEFDDDK